MNKIILPVNRPSSVRSNQTSRPAVYESTLKFVRVVIVLSN
jgi:hypothetical protein